MFVIQTLIQKKFQKKSIYFIDYHIYTIIIYKTIV